MIGPRSANLSLAAPLLPIPIEVWPDVGTQGAASLANESRFKVGQPNVARPSVAADRGPMAAPIRAIDQQAANARGAHLSQGDLLVSEDGHTPLKRGPNDLATLL